MKLWFALFHIIAMWSVVWSSMDQVINLKMQEVMAKHCPEPRHHLIVPTSEIHTAVTNYTRQTYNTTRSSAMYRRSECDVWALKSPEDPSEMVVIINSLDLTKEDVLFVFTDSSSQTYDYNTTQKNLDSFPAVIRTKKTITFIFTRDLDESNLHGKQRLAFTYWLIANVDWDEVHGGRVDTTSLSHWVTPTLAIPMSVLTEVSLSLEEKEKVVMMGAVVISIFTVLATVLSLTRAFKCGWFRNTWSSMQTRKRVRHSNAIALPAVNVAPGRNGNSDEAMALMVVDVQEGQRSISRAALVERSGDDSPELHSLDPRLQAGNVQYMSCLQLDTPDASLVANPAETNSTRQANADQQLRPTSTSPSQPAEALRRDDVAAATSSLTSFSTATLFASRLPTRLRHMQRIISSVHHPQVLSTRPSDLSSGQQLSNTRVTRALPLVMHRSPFDNIHGSSQPQAVHLTSAANQELPPSYQDLPPPSYSTLFPKPS